MWHASAAALARGSRGARARCAAHRHCGDCHGERQGSSQLEACNGTLYCPASKRRIHAAPAQRGHQVGVLRNDGLACAHASHRRSVAGPLVRNKNAAALPLVRHACPTGMQSACAQMSGGVWAGAGHLSFAAHQVPSASIHDPPHRPQPLGMPRWAARNDRLRTNRACGAAAGGATQGDPGVLRVLHPPCSQGGGDARAKSQHVRGVGCS